MSPQRSKQQLDDDTEFRDKVRSIDQTIQEVIKPTMERMASQVETIASKDVVTKSDLKDELKNYVLKAEQTPYNRTLLFIATGVGTVIIVFITNKVLN